MLPHLIVSSVAVGGLVWLVARYRRTPPEQRRVLLRIWMLWGLAAVILWLVLTGRAHWLFAVFAAVMPWLSRALRALGAWRTFRRWQSDAGHPTDGGGGPAHGRMSPAEARQILGIEEGASKEEIMEAHRRLISRLHPDKGGSDHLAQKINQAREALLGK